MVSVRADEAPGLRPGSNKCLSRACLFPGAIGKSQPFSREQEGPIPLPSGIIHEQERQMWRKKSKSQMVAHAVKKNAST